MKVPGCLAPRRGIKVQWSASRHACTFYQKGAVAAAATAADSGAGADEEDRRYDDLECRPSNSMIWSADRQIQRYVF